jgi:hypothetical protein
MAIGQTRRGIFLLVVVATFLGFLLFMSSMRQTTYQDNHQVQVSSDTLLGGVIAPKLGNETLK